MTFELETFSKARIADVLVLAEKDRQPDTDPGVGLDISMTVGNDVLTMFDGALRGMLYTKNANSSAPEHKQATLDGVEPVSDLPNLTTVGQKLGQFGWDAELTGYTLVIDQGLGGKTSNLELSDCVLSNWKFKPKEGGSVEVKFRIESPNIGATTHGKIALLKTREVPITLAPPDVVQQDVEDPT